MKISVLITELQRIQSKEGDCEVFYQFLDSDAADGKDGSIDDIKLVVDDYFETPGQKAVSIEPV